MMDEPAGAFAYAVKAAWASASLAAKIDETDGMLESGSLEVDVVVAALPDDAALDEPEVVLDDEDPSSCAA
jgi:hypothetical protein